MTLKREEIRILCQTNPDAIIALIEQQEARIVHLEAHIAELKAHKNQNSRNSSRPPSTDIYARPQSPRKKGERSPGGQKGHKGNTLTSVENPDEVVVHTVHTCTGCGASLESVTPENVESRQVGDIPKPVLLFTEHRVESKRCPHCSQLHRRQVKVRAPTLHTIF